MTTPRAVASSQAEAAAVTARLSARAIAALTAIDIVGIAIVISRRAERSLVGRPDFPKSTPG
jgi:hypothetical protein